MSSIIDKARTDMLSAFQDIGDSYVLEGVSITGGKHDLTSEELANEGMDGLNMEGVRLCFDSSLLTAESVAIPVPQQDVTLDGDTWSVKRKRLNGSILKLTLARYTS